MKEFNINDYAEQLKQICSQCPKSKCKDHNAICFRKKLVFNIASKVYKKREKEKQNDECI